MANRSYQEFAEHYHMALLPARVLTPKGKATVKGNVGKIITHIIARLHNEEVLWPYRDECHYQRMS